MRAVESNWYRNFLSNLSLTKNRYDDAVSQVTSGKKLNRLSDNPADMAYVLNLRGKIEQIDQFDKNISSGKSYLTAAESAMNSIQNSIYRVVTLTEQGASETSTTEGRITIATEIDQIRDSILNFANTQVMGKYVFSGSATDTVPFVKDPVGPPPDVVNYVGDGSYTNIQADFSIQVSTNIPGNEIFGVSNPPAALAPVGNRNIFEDLLNLRNALLADDTTLIGNAMTNIGEIQDQVSQYRGDVGNNLRHLTDIQGMLKSFQNSLRIKMSNLEDADMAQAISNLSKEEVGLQATLQAGARIQRYSLMNYIG